MSDETAPQDVPTVRSRLAMLGEEAIAEHFAAGRIYLDGERVTDLDAPAPAGTRPVLRAS
ncbi:hypothetical protein WHI96_27155 [Pseudonocardia tropica]|uniref:Pseudouridine synthase n=1 Tax=Pseudonocardia tropica TaxID=681289 RepID=A0ABV1K2N8_9PSEU